MAKGVEDTAFYRFNRLRRAERGRRRPGPLRHLARRSSTRASASAQARWPRHAARHLDARHQAQRGRARAARRCSPRSRRAGRDAVARWARAERARTAADGCPTATPSTSSTRRSSAPGRSSAPRALAYMEKAAREAKRAHLVDRAGRGLRGRAARASSQRRLGDAGLRGGASRRSSRRSVAPGRINSLAQTLAQAHRARRARHLPGHRALGPEPRRSRTTAGPSTTRGAARCSPRSTASTPRAIRRAPTRACRSSG